MFLQSGAGGLVSPFKEVEENLFPLHSETRSARNRRLSTRAAASRVYKIVVVVEKLRAEREAQTKQKSFINKI